MFSLNKHAPKNLTLSNCLIWLCYINSYWKVQQQICEGVVGWLTTGSKALIRKSSSESKNRHDKQFFFRDDDFVRCLVINLTGQAFRLHVSYKIKQVILREHVKKQKYKDRSGLIRWFVPSILTKVESKPNQGRAAKLHVAVGCSDPYTFAYWKLIWISQMKFYLPGEKTF